jgi:hypothetical protein
MSTFWTLKLELINFKQKNLEKAIKYFLDCTAKWTPRWFNKPKFHLILHLLFHILHFGPATVFATEAQESYNAIIRAWSIHSNRRSPSHDIAHQAAGLARIRHLVSGGFYEAEVEQADGSTCKKWITAGPDVVKLGQTPSIITKRLGISFKEERATGNILFIYCLCFTYTRTGEVTYFRLDPTPWSETKSSRFFPNVQSFNTLFQSCKNIVIANGDKVGIGDHIACSSQDHLGIVKIHEILSASNGMTRILVQSFKVGPLVLPYMMPSLRAIDHYFLAEPLVCVLCF